MCLHLSSSSFETTVYIQICLLQCLLSPWDSLVIVLLFSAAEVTLSSLTLASKTATTLSVTWSAGYPKCYSFTVSHSTQDGSITVSQPADSDTSHTLTSLQPGTTYRIEVEAVRKGDGADGQRAKVMGSFTTDGEETRLQTLMPFVAALFTMKAYGCRKGYCKCCQPSASLLHYVYLFIFS